MPTIVILRNQDVSRYTFRDLLFFVHVSSVLIGAVVIPNNNIRGNTAVLVSDTFPAVAEHLAKQLGLDLLSNKRKAVAAEINYVLSVEPFGAEDYAIGLSQKSKSGSSWTTPYHVNFEPAPSSPQSQRLKQRDLLLQAIGKESQVIDATAGWGSDAFVMAQHHDVLMVERHPVVATMLQDALRRIKDDPLASRLRLVVGDFPHIRLPPTPVVYLDPMFPPRKKKAMVKKNMQILHGLLPDDIGNNEELFYTAKTVAASRVVVKRPIHSEWLTKDKPSYAISGPTNRWDIYLL